MANNPYDLNPENNVVSSEVDDKNTEDIPKEEPQPVEQDFFEEQDTTDEVKDKETLEQPKEEIKEEKDLFTEEPETITFTEPRHVDVPVTHVQETGGSKTPKFKVKKIKEYDKDIGRVIHTLRGTAQSVLASLQRIDADELNRDELSEWLKVVNNASETNMLARDQLFEATVRNGSMWVNMVNANTEEGTEARWMGPMPDTRFKNPTNKEDKTFSALSLLKSCMALGTPAYIPLYHTGIWLYLETPSAQEFAQLDEIILNSKISYGKMTRGDIYSNDSVIMRKHIKDFILDHVKFSTAPSDDKTYLSSIIRSTDLDIMMLGIMLTRFPDGYPLSVPCTVDPKVCTHVVEGEVDLRGLNWIDRSRLTDRQIKLMSNPYRRLTQEQIEEYQEEFHFENNKIVFSLDPNGQLVIVKDDEDIANGVILNIRTPTLEREENYGVSWINELQRSAEKVFQETNDPTVRDIKIRERIVVSFFKSYGQWVESIQLIQGSEVQKTFTEADNLDEILIFLSSDSRYVKHFVNSVMKYINSNLIQIVGVKNFECPNCGKKHDTAEGGHYLILPIDTLNTFFLFVQSVVHQVILEPVT